MSDQAKKRDTTQVAPNPITTILTGSSLKSRAARFVGVLGAISSLDTILARFDLNLIAQAGFTHWLFFSVLFNLFLISELFLFPEVKTAAQSTNTDDDENEIRVFHYILPTDGI